MAISQVRLHSGHDVPQRLLSNIARWNQAELTPGWLDGLAETVASLCQKWEITLDPEIPVTDMTLVLLGHSARLGPVAIKSSPLGDEFRAEATALGLASGEHVARLFDLDLPCNAMVIERIVPGTQLRQVEMSDDEATRLAAGMVARMWRPVHDPAGLIPLRRWMAALFDWPVSSERIPSDLIWTAQRLAESLLAGSREDSLLHGDFQHHNLLRREDGSWAIIDPKGLVGPRGFEIAAWMYNPPGVTERADYLDLAARRFTICAEVWGIDERELIEWAFVGAVLSCCWTAGESSPAGLFDYFLTGARSLRTLVP